MDFDREKAKRCFDFTEKNAYVQVDKKRRIIYSILYIRRLKLYIYCGESYITTLRKNGSEYQPINVT